jgi:hypothetical protein
VRKWCDELIVSDEGIGVQLSFRAFSLQPNNGEKKKKKKKKKVRRPP